MAEDYGGALQTVICPDHQAKSADFVALNTKKEQVFRCNGGAGPPHMPHHFTISKEAKERLAKAAKGSI